MKRPPLAIVAWLVLALGLFISLAAWQLARHGEQETSRLRAERATDEVSGRLRQRMDGYEQLLRSAAALFAASGHVSREEWQRYYATLQVERNYPGVQGVAFARRVLAADLAEYEREVRSRGFPGFTIRPAGPRPEMTPIDYIEPMDERNQRAFGFDMFSEPRRRRAMERARDHHVMALSAPVRLMQEDDQGQPQAGVLLYYPVYRPGLPLQTVGQRRAALLGYVYCPFRMHDLLYGVFGDELQHMQLQLRDVSQPGGEPLYISAPRDLQARPPHTMQQRVLDMAGRRWQLLYEPLDPVQEAGLPRSTLLLWGGMVFSLLSFGLLLSLMTIRQRALALAADLSVAHRSSEARMRAIFDSTADAILSVDMQGTILAANQVTQDLFGWRVDELIGRHTHALVPERDQAWVDQLYQELREGEWPRDYRREMTARHRDGHLFPVQVSGTRVVIEGVTQLVMLVRDLSSQKQAERELRRADAQREALLNHAPLCILSTDLGGRLTAINPAGEHLLGWSASTALGQPLAMLERSAADSPSLGQLLHDAAARRVAEGEWLFRRPDDTEVPVWASVAALHDQQDQLFGFIGIVQDMTSRRRTEAALRSAREEAEAASRAKSEFLANMSHEIRTPMNAVLGMAHLLGTEPLSRQQQGWLDMLNRSGRALLGILNDILDFSKVEAGRMELVRAPFALTEVLDAMASLMALPSSEREVQPRIDEPEEDLVLLGDALRLQQTLTNLVDNALKFTEYGEVCLSVRTVWREARRIRLEFRVRDSGIGMNEQQIERLFQPFSQADNSTTRRYGGTGLGLAISRRLIELHGSQIEVSSTPGVGSQFWFELDYEVEQSQRPALRLPPHLAGLHLQAQLQHAGYAEALQTACDALGWKLAAPDTAADVLLCEWPNRFDDGLRRLAGWLKQAGGRPLLLLICSHWRERVRQLPQLAAATALLEKPLNRRALLQAVREVLPPPAPASTVSSRHGPLSLHGLRVLLAEDHPVNQLLTRTVLEQAGAQVDIVENGLLAVEALRQQPQHWHVVLMDAQMPVMDGFTATRILREHLGSQLPIIALSAGVLEAERERCLACGMNDFVAKPLDVPRLLQLLHRFLPTG